jgi:hypothetical protein
MPFSDTMLFNANIVFGLGYFKPRMHACFLTKPRLSIDYHSNNLSLFFKTEFRYGYVTNLRHRCLRTKLPV